MHSHCHRLTAPAAADCPIGGDAQRQTFDCGDSSDDMSAEVAVVAVAVGLVVPFRKKTVGR